MHLSRRIAFDVDVDLPFPVAVDFVRNVGATLRDADFVDDVTVDDSTEELGHGGGVVEASLVVNASMFGQRRLPFVSDFEPTKHGARLRGRTLDRSVGWARVDGEASVRAAPMGSVLSYTFDVDIHLVLPEPERWGGRALLKMVEVTADRVLARLNEAFPAAIASAAARFEAAAPLAVVGD